MQISESDIQNTVLELFATRGLVAGEMMWLSRLEKFWLKTRLRRQDLLNGVAQLCSDGMLDLDEQDGEAGLVLTVKGQQRAADILRSGVGYWAGYLQKELLPTVRVVALPASSDGPGRRDYEVSGAAQNPWFRNSA